MFKRRDWRNLKGSHGGAGAGDSSSDDSDSDAEERRARLRQTQGDPEGESSEEGSSGEDEEGSSEGDDRLGDEAIAAAAAAIGGEGRDSEGSDGDDSDDGDGPSAQDIIDAWTGSDEALHGFRSVPLRCMPCKVLLLNRTTYLQHVASKAHRNKLKARGGSDDGVIILARHASIAVEEEAETHAERLARLRAFAAAKNDIVGAAAPSASDDSSSDEEMTRRQRAGKSFPQPSKLGSAGAGNPVEDGGISLPKPSTDSADGSEAAVKKIKGGKARPERKRLGKRQRQMLKAEGKDPATGKAFNVAKRNKRQQAAAVAATTPASVVKAEETNGKAQKTAKKQAVAKPGNASRTVVPAQAAVKAPGSARPAKQKHRVPRAKASKTVA